MAQKTPAVSGTEPAPAGPPDLHPVARWYAAYTCARHEKQVRKQLEEKSIDCFLPLYRSVRRWRDRRKELELALFPGYVFVHIAAQDRLRLLQTASVVRFVTSNGQLAALDDSEIESLRNGIANGAKAEPHPYLRVGQKVRVKHGPLAGAEGILVRKKDRCRLVLSLEIIMRSVAAEVDVADLE